jgi:hypothetical protein
LLREIEATRVQEEYTSRFNFPCALLSTHSRSTCLYYRVNDTLALHYRVNCTIASLLHEIQNLAYQEIRIGPEFRLRLTLAPFSREWCLWGAEERGEKKDEKRKAANLMPAAELEAIYCM